MQRKALQLSLQVGEVARLVAQLLGPVEEELSRAIDNSMLPGQVPGSEWLAYIDQTYERGVAQGLIPPSKPEDVLARRGPAYRPARTRVHAIFAIDSLNALGRTDPPARPGPRRRALCA